MAQDHSAAAVQAQLITDGLDAASATIVAENTRSQFQEAYLDEARANMRKGALWFVGGSLVTGVTYALASENGGSYFMTWGAIGFGGFQLLQGVYQYFKHK